ncbi:CubicO group peptidase (beta-lactamase class C family) [Saonia flava]|uniref:CubicO group peptidase (Beta-lactamase class C family) n=1 Tax=Saonia flava TaxID=523696 RepID=A0A846QYW8_9FLAO|nr:serine hydrolase domain-containing protein [Saonia flava]NJB70835.1 CubicO group peptidase (beta-lactamase class C family) [Saonia flava]
MNPIFTYLKNLIVSKKILGEDNHLKELVKADILLKDLVDKDKVPGLAITALRDGKTIFQKGYGYANMDTGELIDPQKSIFRIASVSKPIAATALAKMVEEGIIDLNASLYDYVPYFPKKKYDFTIRQLANHTAGIRGYRGKEYALNEAYSIKDSIDIFKEDDLVFQPGTDYLYNSFDWVLVSLAMQEASGIPFEEYVKEKVLKPMGMTNTFSEIKNEHSNLTTFYTKTKLGFRESISVNNFYKLAGGGFLSTSEDIAKLGQAYLDKKTGDKAILSHFLTSEKIKGKPTYYGLGWQVSFDKTGRPFYGHVGNGVGGYSNFYIYPEEQMVFSILINCTDPKVQPELDEVISTLILNCEELI